MIVCTAIIIVCTIVTTTYTSTCHIHTHYALTHTVIHTYIPNIQMLSLQSIGQVRALRVLTLRSAGNQFHTLADLTEIGMNDKTIARFLKANAGQIVAKVQDGEI